MVVHLFSSLPFDLDGKFPENGIIVEIILNLPLSRKIWHPVI